MALIAGSVALQQYVRLKRQPKDVDYIIRSTDERSIYHGGDIFSDESLDEWVGEFHHGRNRLLGLSELYTLKISHSYWELPNGSWGKHIADIALMKQQGGKLIPDLHKTLYSVWEKVHGKKKVNLSMEKDSFFKDAVKRVYDHDSIHDSVAFGDSAMYESILKDGSTVDVDSKKMWALSHEDLVKLFREEIAATALERIMIPKEYKSSPGAAYQWALRRTVTSLTKGRSATFLLDNIEEFIRPDNYLDRHFEKIDRLVKL